MKIEYLREFLALADEMNLTKVSGNLFISQSTLSRHMKALEKSLGFALIKTTSHGVTLTDAGKDAVRTFRSITSEYDSFIAAHKPAEDNYSGTLRVGLMYYLVDGPYMEFIDRFRESHPDVDIVCLSSYQPQTLYEDLLLKKVDVGLLPSYLGNLAKVMNYRKIESLGAIAMLRDDDPLALRESVTLDELKDHMLVRLSIDTLSQSQVEALLSDYCFEPAGSVMTENIETVPSRIKRTGGCHITGTPCLKQKATGIAYIPVSDARGFELGIASAIHGDKLIDHFIREITRT